MRRVSPYREGSRTSLFLKADCQDGRRPAIRWKIVSGSSAVVIDRQLLIGEDKERFNLGFSRRLRRHGICAGESVWAYANNLPKSE